MFDILEYFNTELDAAKVVRDDLSQQIKVIVLLSFRIMINLTFSMIKLTFSFQKDLKSLNRSDYDYLNESNIALFKENMELSERVDALKTDLMRINKEGI